MASILVCNAHPDPLALLTRAEPAGESAALNVKREVEHVFGSSRAPMGTSTRQKIASPRSMRRALARVDDEKPPCQGHLERLVGVRVVHLRAALAAA